jgi:hypothetical protein
MLLKKVLNFPKIDDFYTFFSEISGNFRIFRIFSGKKFPDFSGFSGKFSREKFAEMGCIIARLQKKPEKNATVFRRFFRGFSGGFSPRFSVEIFKKNMKFDHFSLFFTCTCAVPQSVFCKKHKI